MPIAKCGIQFSWSSPDCKSNNPKCEGCPIKKKETKRIKL